MKHSKNISMAEEIMLAWEDEIPELAATATSNAYKQALASGSTVLVSDKGSIWEVSPDGSRKFVKNAPPKVTVTVGEVRYLR